MPSRLIELQIHRISLRDEVNIEGNLSDFRYVCLSHCWGTGPTVCKLTTRNIESLKEGGFPALPRTFRDATQICLRLGFKFLWIDSLCIIQDNDRDWAFESAEMGNIYENAFLNIVATSSKDSGEGCYRALDQSYLPKPIEPRIFVRRHVPILPTSVDEFEKDASEWPLLKRGWTFQELRLARRKIHFGNHEAIWECRCGRWSGSGINNRMTEIRRGATVFDSFYFSDTQEKKDCRTLWWKVVEEYSGLDLTKAKDRLPALAALALRMKNYRENDKYYAGLWNTTIHYDLL